MYNGFSSSRYVNFTLNKPIPKGAKVYFKVRYGSDSNSSLPIGSNLYGYNNNTRVGVIHHTGNKETDYIVSGTYSDTITALRWQPINETNGLLFQLYWIYA